MKPYLSLVAIVKPYPTLFTLGKCYLMVLRGRIFKFKVQAYHVKQRSYTVTECGSGDVIELARFQQDEFDTIMLMECGKCNGRPGSRF